MPTIPKAKRDRVSVPGKTGQKKYQRDENGVPIPPVPKPGQTRTPKVQPGLSKKTGKRKK